MEDLSRCAEVLKNKISLTDLGKMSIKEVHKLAEIEQKQIIQAEKDMENNKITPYNRHLYNMRVYGGGMLQTLNSQIPQDNERTASHNSKKVNIPEMLKQSGNLVGKKHPG